MHEELSLVVAGAAGVDAIVLVARLERRSDPLVERVRRLDVVMAVDEHGRRFRARLHPFGRHDRVVRRLVDRRPLDADSRELVRDPLRSSAHLLGSAGIRARRSRCAGTRPAARSARSRARAGRRRRHRCRREYRSGSSWTDDRAMSPMQPMGTPARLSGHMKLLLAALFAIGLASVPLEQVAACSCAQSTPEQARGVRRCCLRRHGGQLAALRRRQRPGGCHGGYRPRAGAPWPDDLHVRGRRRCQGPDRCQASTSSPAATARRAA